MPLLSFPARSAIRRRQRGATLVVALIVLVLIMMVGIMSISSSDTQFRLAGNVQFSDSALNNAEAAVAAAEQWLGTGTNRNDPGFTTYDPAKPWLLPPGYLAGLAPATTSADRAFSMADSNDANSLAVNDNNAQRYFIEQMSRNSKLLGSSQVLGGRGSASCNQVNTYLITARGLSARGATKFVQSYYSTLNCST